MREMLNLAWDYRARWKFLGIELGFDMGTLDAISKNNTNVEESLTDLISKWLRKSDPRATRSDISKALQSPMVSDGAQCKIHTL